MLNLGLIAAFASMMFLSSDIAIAKHLTKRLGKFRYSVGILGIGIIPMLIYALAVGIHAYSMEIVILSLLAGAFLGAGYVLYYKALETEQITNVSSIGEIQPAFLLLFGVFILGEKITLIEIAGIFSIFVGSFLVLRTRGLEINRVMIPVIVANILWVVYWILMDYAITLPVAST
ncbi:DMT family transporter, partial [Candidatus Marsarchaeota archaeon]|nr:DMT family transporter [Candidatus Marsarchaeota archaeon]